MLSSPNASWTIPAPPHTRELQLRCDGRFGLDDPLNFPQPATVSHEYLACIPTQEHDMLSRFWQTPLTSEEITQLPGTPAVYHLSPVKQHLMEDFRTQLAERVALFRAKASTSLRGPLETLFHRCNAAYQVLLDRVDRALFVQYRWAMLSRWCLELVAYLDYYTVFLPRLSHPRRNLVDRFRVGAIAVTSELVQDFFKMGLPIWHIRPLSCPTLFPSKMVYLTPPSKPSYDVDLTPAPGHMAVTVDFWSPKYLSHLHDWARHTPLSGSLTSDDSLVASGDAGRTKTAKKRKADNTKDGQRRCSKKVLLAGNRGKGKLCHLRYPIPDAHIYSDFSCA